MTFFIYYAIIFLYKHEILLIMIKCEEEIEQFNVTQVFLNEKDFNTKIKDNINCTFHDKVKELISNQHSGLDSVYWVTHDDIKDFIQQIVYSNKTNTIIYQPETELISIFDNNFSFLFEIHSFEGNSVEQWIRGPNWKDDLDSMLRLIVDLKNSNNEHYSIKPHSKRTNEFHCQSSSEDNQISLFAFKEDHVKVNFHLSAIKNMTFDLNGKIQSINLLDRISTQTYTNLDDYKAIIEKTSQDVEFYTLCTDKIFSIMKEDVFNKNIEFISNIIEAYKDLNIKKLFQSNDFIVNHFNDLKIIPSFSKMGFAHKKELYISQTLINTEYEKYRDTEIENENSDTMKRKVLKFLAYMKLKNNNIDNILTPKVLNEIKYVNSSVEKIVNAGIKTIEKKVITKKTLKN